MAQPVIYRPIHRIANSDKIAVAEYPTRLLFGGKGVGHGLESTTARCRSLDWVHPQSFGPRARYKSGEFGSKRQLRDRSRSRSIFDIAAGHGSNSELDDNAR